MFSKMNAPPKTRLISLNAFNSLFHLYKKKKLRSNSEGLVCLPLDGEQQEPEEVEQRKVEGGTPGHARVPPGVRPEGQRRSRRVP